ncbi:CPCC family cysteine-rich protein [Aerococcus urinae]|uniref:CPCC family cysteine-rich protein n=1 Tax=Aerococcus urinae TaxID=1376 RepID=UPI002549CBBD|nr:CPCC family cysteine-rich protein [Aerococcus urinae]MDK6729054.1 CPCC family cysteine-rich protein [Aerococcus urinae]
MEDINKSTSWEIDGELWLHCPVCGKNVRDYDICDHCHWQNTGETNIDGGPNKMTLAETKEAYAKGLKIE